MLSLYFAAVIALSATTVLSAPAHVNEARDVESHLSARNFYWQCPQGQYFTGNPPPSTNPGACTGCQPGTFSPDGVNCYVTPKGFYNDKAGAFDPVGCLPGTYTDSTGSQVCQPCTAPMMSYAASTKCVPCADGSTSIDSRSCTRCPPGSSSVNGAACGQCQPGTFYAGIACHATPAGFYNDKPGASDPIGCLPGTYTDTTGAIICKACASPLMSYAAFAKCIPCADGLTSNDGQYCVPCPAGTSSKSGSVCSAAKYHIVSYQATDTSHSNPLYVANAYDPTSGNVYLDVFSKAMNILPPSSLSSSLPVALLGTVSIHGSDYNYFNIGFYDVQNSYFYGILSQTSGDETDIWVIGAQDPSTLLWPLSLVLTDFDGNVKSCAKFYATTQGDVVMSCVQQEPVASNFFLVLAS